MKLKCLECGNRFKKKLIITDVSCPKCGGYDLDLDYIEKKGREIDMRFENSVSGTFTSTTIPDEIDHDIIFVRRTGRWVCKCGESGISEKTKIEHEKEITVQVMN